MQRELRWESFHLTAFGPFSRRVSRAHGSLVDANGVTFFLQFGSLAPPDTKVLVHNEEEFKAIPHTIEEIWFAFPVRLLVLSFIPILENPCRGEAVDGADSLL